MKKCISCATENSEHAKFCRKCGTMFISNYTNSDIIVDKKTKKSGISPVFSSILWIVFATLSAFGIYFTFSCVLIPELEEFLKQLIQLEFKMQYIFEGTSLSYVFSALKSVFSYGSFAGLTCALALTFIFSFFGLYVNIKKALTSKSNTGKKPVILFKVYSVCFKIYIAIILITVTISGLMALLSILL